MKELARGLPHSTWLFHMNLELSLCDGKDLPNKTIVLLGRKKKLLENTHVLMFCASLIILSDIIDVDSNCKVNLERLSV